MKIYQITAEQIKDSRDNPTINIILKTNYGDFQASAPSGKSVGKYEVKPYAIGLKNDIGFLNKLKLSEILCFIDLKKVEKKVKGKIGANSLFALEACLLKALAAKNKKELWYYLLKRGKVSLPRPVGNVIGGGLHSKGIEGRRPDFQEFLFIPNSKTFKECVDMNNVAYKLVKKYLGIRKRNDEGAWETGGNNKEVLEVMNKVKDEIEQEYKQKILIGVDVAASSFYKKARYVYKNPKKALNSKEQLEHMKNLVNEYNVFYIEDGFSEIDFANFAKLNKGRNIFVVGDDLTVTNTKRLKKAIKMKAISGAIIKPNQIGSLLKTKEAIDICKKNNIKTIISHRSGETEDATIADLAVAWGCDFIKTGVYGNVREVKLNRLIDIEKSLKRK